MAIVLSGLLLLRPLAFFKGLVDVLLLLDFVFLTTDFLTTGFLTVFLFVFFTFFLAFLLAIL